jgi:hypothetical protein
MKSVAISTDHGRTALNIDAEVVVDPGRGGNHEYREGRYRGDRNKSESSH